MKSVAPPSGQGTEAALRLWRDGSRSIAPRNDSVAGRRRSAGELQDGGRVSDLPAPPVERGGQPLARQPLPLPDAEVGGYWRAGSGSGEGRPVRRCRRRCSGDRKRSARATGAHRPAVGGDVWRFRKRTCSSAASAPGWRGEERPPRGRRRAAPRAGELQGDRPPPAPPAGPPGRSGSAAPASPAPAAGARRPPSKDRAQGFVAAHDFGQTRPGPGRRPAAEGQGAEMLFAGFPGRAVEEPHPLLREGERK